MFTFKKATRRRAYLRLALCGPAGSGKSFTGLRVAMGLLDPGQRLAVIDTEHGSAELYADEPNPDGGRFDFDCIRLDLQPGKFSPENYIRALRAAADNRYPVILVDSLSHAWAGEGGVLDLVDNVAARGGRGGEGNKFAAWRHGSKAQNELVDTLLSYPGQVIVTLRTKVEYVLETDEKGRKVPRKVGMASVQRDGVDYEFTVIGDIDVDTHRLYITKSRCSAVADRNYLKAGADLARELRDWLERGDEPDRPAPARQRGEEGPPDEGDDDTPSWTESQDRSPLAPGPEGRSGDDRRPDPPEGAAGRVDPAPIPAPILTELGELGWDGGSLVQDLRDFAAWSGKGGDPIKSIAKVPAWLRGVPQADFDAWQEQHGQLSALLPDVPMEHIDGWCRAKGRPVFAAMDRATRAKFIAYLRDAGGLDQVRQHLLEAA